jgi:hypothetical protein
LKYIVERTTQFFNEYLLSKNTPQLADFHNKTQIGENVTQYKSFFDSNKQIPKFGKSKILMILLQKNKKYSNCKLKI